MPEYLLYFNQQWVGDHPEEWFGGRGPLAMADLTSGNVQLMFATVASSIGMVKANRLRPIAIINSKRFPGMPDLPTVAEAVQSMQRRRAGVGMERRVPIEPPFQRGDKRLARGGRRLGRALRRHQAGAQLAHDLFPLLEVAVDGSRIHPLE